MMGTFVSKLHTWIQAFGWSPRITIDSLKNVGRTFSEFRLLRKQNQGLNEQWKLNFSLPVFNDRHDSSGSASGHYFHQDLLVARRIYACCPKVHVDVGSRVDGFVSHLAVFREVEVFDIRPQQAEIPNITFRQVDFMGDLKEFEDYCDSLSCLHALEHFGLGRYGDPIDIDGHLKGIDCLHSILRERGTLYLSVPIGRERIDFNGHRVFSIGRLLKLLNSKFALRRFSYVDDQGNLHEDADLGDLNSNSSFDLEYGCGIFELEKL